MLKTERRRRTFSFSAEGKCRHPSLKPAGLAEAENLLRNSPLKDTIIEDEELAELMLPQLPTTNNRVEEEKIVLLDKMLSKFHMTDPHLLHLEKRMMDAINQGLAKATNPKADVKSFPTYVHDLPTGKEQGQFLALDLGGTNFRVILVTLDADSRSIKMKSSKHEVGEKLMLGPGSDLFDFMVNCLYNFMQHHNLLGHRYHLGFTFSFPTAQRGLAAAELTNWTKGYVCEGVEGKDVGKLLEEAIERRGGLDIKVDALINDTTGCLLACAYKRPECAIGIILGTGTNSSYMEDMKNVEMYEGSPSQSAKKVIINTEWGAFGNSGSLDIIRTKYDIQLDQESRNPGQQIYEKLISGMYLGELTRLIIVDVINHGILFDGRRQPVLETAGSFQTRYISDIESDETRDSFVYIKEVLTELGLINVATPLDMRVLRYICECVSNRAASLAGAGVASLINKISRRRITVGMDGSVYKFHPYFSHRMHRIVQRLVCDCIQFEFVLSEDGSGRGAALAAAVASK